MSQSCLPTGITFLYQSQIDSFSINYPNCTQIEGNVSIGGYLNDITNLNGLSTLVSIGGSCSIISTDYLVDLTGLGSLKSIGGSFTLQNNSALASFTGIDSLVTIGGQFQVYEANRIKNFDGLEGLKIVKQEVWIRNNDSITSLSGLNNLIADSLAGFWADDNAMLSNCAIKSVCDFLNLPFHHADFYWNTTGCNSEYEVENACAGLSVNNAKPINKFSIFPNPATTNFRVETKELSSEIELSILNLSGQVLLKIHKFDLRTSIDIENLNRGIYFVKIANQSVIDNLKFIKN